jgi:predicted membrane channel-forming protein YqfA (hemolysin III family)
VGGAAFCVFVEVLLNAIGALTWDYPWWSARAPWLIFLFGYLHFFLVSFWVHDMESVKSKAVTVGAIFGFDLVCVLVFGVILGWL